MRVLAAAILGLGGVVAPAAGTLPAPTELTVAGSGETAFLTWRQPSGERARAFRVYESGVEITRNTTTSAQLTNLGFARTRTYTVTAVDGAGRESPHSAPISRQVGVSGVPPMCSPAPLDGLAASGVTASAVTLTWTGNGDPGTTMVTGAPAGPVSTDGSGVRIGGLSPATTYTFEVTHLPGCFDPVPQPAHVTVTTAPGEAGTPESPAGVTVTGRTDTTLGLAWQPPAGGAAGYAVYESGRRVATTTGASTVVRGLYHAAGYTFQVAALDARGNESPAIAVSGTTAACQARPPRPAAVTAIALSASSVRLSWEYDAAATGYTIFDGTGAAVGTSAGTATVLSGLASATAYSLRVAATLAGGCGRSAASAWVNVTTPPGAAGRPTRPAGLRMVSGDPMTGVVTLEWTQPPGGVPPVSYRVYRGADVLTTADTTRVALALPQATTQVLTVAAVDGRGLESAQSAPLTVRVPYLPPP
ncbi:fibronectin type III domain-containing protein [Micromonospora sp. CPCC 205371]|nr:fibronectin type III domain-containing protein [Micromonospora sp. CPCC 205371]